MLSDSFATAAALRWTGVSFPRMEDGQLCDGPRVFGMCAHGAAVGSGKFTSNIPHRCLRFACFLCCDIIDVLWNLDSYQLSGDCPVGSCGQLRCAADWSAASGEPRSVKLRYSTSAAIFHSGLRSNYAQSMGGELSKRQGVLFD